MYWIHWVLLYFCWCITYMRTEVVESTKALDNTDICRAQQRCGECLSASPRCAWCMQPGFGDVNMTHSIYCDVVETLLDNGCDVNYIVNTRHEATIIKQDPPRDADSSRDALQLSPQEIHIKIRPKLPYSMDVSFRLAKDYPVDLYYIMDLSNTMIKSLGSVANLGNQLAEEMQSITYNFQLGFGSYIDKKISPYASIIAEKLENPCASRECVPTYAFKNHLTLTRETQRFTATVQNAKISGNLDAPESTLDAMMQAVACKNQIGWRDVSRKILLVSTDNIYHYAGDGKLAGIVKPNDGLCHLDETHEYNMSLSQDYPSISHLAHRIAEENINVIFAIINNRGAFGAYESLPTLMRGAVVVALTETSSNILEVIKNNYEKISGKVVMKHDAPEGVEVTFSSSCLGGIHMNTSVCEGLKVLDNVTFTVTVNVTKCPADPTDWTKVVTIYPEGLADRLTIRLDLQCECPCEKADFPAIGEVTAPEINSNMCNGSGTYECGACTCNPGRNGSNCECSADNGNMCKRTESSAVCEGRGTCYCGQCLCDTLSAGDRSRVYSGQYCQCNDYSCDYHAGKLCGGGDRGRCDCGACHCLSGFTGPACNCPTSTRTCMSRNKKVCSGHGQCICGKCQCEKKYQGKTCEDCPSCGYCEMNKACVQCTVFGSGPYSKTDCQANCSHVLEVAQIINDETSDTLVCKFRDEDTCDFYFTYTRSTQQVHVQAAKECPEPVNMIGIIAGVTGSITVIGICLLVVWKAIITVYDRREYEKFERERCAAKWPTADNPLYKPNISTFKNPTFDKNK